MESETTAIRAEDVRTVAAKAKPEETPEQRVARLVPRAILQDGVDFEVTRNRTSRLRRFGLGGKARRFTVYPICAGALFELSKIITAMPSIEANAGDNLFSVGIRSILDSKDRMLEVVAVAILNRKMTRWTRFRAWRIRRFLDANLDAHELLRLVGLVVDQMGVADFLASTVSIRRLNLVETERTDKPATTPAL